MKSPTTPEQAREMAAECGQKANAFMQDRDYHNARYQIECARELSLLALRLEENSPSPAPSPRPVTVAPELSPASATPAGAAFPSKSGTGGSLIELPEEVPFQ